MSSNAELEVMYRMAATPIRPYPSPHLYVEEVFEPSFYRRLLDNLPSDDSFSSISATGRTYGAYEQRHFFKLTTENVINLPQPQIAFWREMGGWLLSDAFKRFAMSLFAPYVKKRVDHIKQVNQTDAVGTAGEVLVVRDRTRYAIGPHTDSPSKLMSFLFYLPRDDSLSHLGTSLYLPKDRSFLCEGGPHYKHDDFDLMHTMPYRPNTLFAFMKTDRSFHGVEPIQDEGVRRDLILYDIRIEPHEQTPLKHAEPAMA